MSIQISISNAIGSRYRGSVVPPIDPDAQAFITAASITDPTQQAAINQLVVDLKGYSIWTKFSALYPMVGGTAAQHKWNLKDPRDLDAAFRLTFSGGWTHSSTGALPNGTNAYADTFLTPSTSLSLNSSHLSYYSRTNSNGTEIEIGVNTSNNYNLLEIRTSGTSYFLINQAALTTVSDANSLGFYVGNRQASNDIDGWKNGVKLINGTTASTILPTNKIFLGAYNNGGAFALPTTKQCAFASIGDGLTDTDAANFYTAVQTFQTTLGRSIGTQTVSDADAQAFVTNAGIVDQVEANAINNLVIGMKADSLWTKMKAVYPFVGGTATTNKYNLKNPLDTNAAFRLVFNGGWTHSANGATPNGTNAYADTNFIPSSNLTTSSAHFSKYNRTNDLTPTKIDGVIDSLPSETFFQLNYTGANGLIGEIGGIVTYTQTDTRGLFTVVRTATNSSKVFKNSTQQGSTNTTTISTLPDFNVYIGARNSGVGQFFNTYQCAFASLGDGLTDTDVTNLNTRVTTFQTALNRNV